MTDKGASLVAMQEMWVQSLSWEDPLEEGIATPRVWRARQEVEIYESRETQAQD